MSGSQLLHDELKSIGIKSIIMPIVPFSMDLSITKMSMTHRVLNYIPKGRERFYGTNMVVDLASRNPDVIFDIVGTERFEKMDEVPGNLYFHGKVSSGEMKKMLALCLFLVHESANDIISRGTFDETVYDLEECPAQAW